MIFRSICESIVRLQSGIKTRAPSVITMTTKTAVLTDFDMKDKVEALSAAVRDGDSKLVSKFFDNLETEGGDDKLNLAGSAIIKKAKNISNNHDVREVLDDAGEENKNAVETKEGIEKLYTK